MKRVFHHPAEPAQAPGGKKYWRSLNELAGTPEFEAALEREFPQGAAEFNGGEVSRRHFMQLMGASTALAGIGLAGCRRPEMHLVPFTKSAEWVIPGKFLFYSSSMPSPRGYVPVIVSTYEGRPIKIEGNPYHPINDGHGGTDLYTQASVLNLYDPDRARLFLEKGTESDETKFRKFLDQLIAAYSGKQGDGLAFLMQEDPSPTRERLRAAVEAKLPMARWCVYEPLGADNAAAAEEIGFGPEVKLRPLLDKADVVLALDCDFLGSAEGTIEGIKGFTKKRRIDAPGGKMNRLYAVENRFTITGGMADHRLRMPASQVGEFAVRLAAEIFATTGDATLATVCQTLGKTKGANQKSEWVEELAKDLVANRGRALVLAGSQQPVAVHLLVAAINFALGALGNTLVGIAAVSKAAASIGQLAGAIKDKKVSTLVILGGNPVYNAPADLEWAKLQQTVPNVIRVGHYVDETSQLATWFVPRAHYLECWGDGRSVDGTYVAVQPMILPLYGGWSDNDVLAKFAGLPKPQGPELVQETFRQVAPGPAFDSAWNNFLHDGFVAGSNTGTNRTLFFLSAATGSYIAEHANLPALSGEGNYEIVFTPDFHTYDGRYNNNGWLQEAPDPVTKLTWDNAALISPATAKELGVANENHQSEGDMIEISLENGAKLELPILIAPGHADRSISISLGHGRTATGRVGTGTGYNVYPLRTTQAPYFAFTQSVKPTGRRGVLAITQEHFSMEGRAFVREGTTQTFEENPTFAKVMGLDEELPKAGNPSLYTHPPLTAQEQWGMAIDLNTCTGCNACVIACQAENNSPIVGKEQVINGREMHWMRMDRYFASTDETDPDPEMLFEPLLCQQCENAPCETVCPVNATVHTPDGLNSMAYNRCIGTRYCANNCPYKVRRFNFFDYNQRPIQNHQLYLGPLTEKASPDTIKMQKNPNVTVRMRGVMEKCTFCVQRIEEARIATKVKAGASDKVKIPVDAFQSACQQACPNEAIAFGDITEPESKVSKLRGSPRGYRLLEYLNTSPRVLYLAKIRNPNPRMPGAEKVGAFEKEDRKGTKGGEQ